MADETALRAVVHLNRDSACAAMAISAWLDDPEVNAGVPAEADRMLAHIADAANAARGLLAAEAADLSKIRTIGDPS